MKNKKTDKLDYIYNNYLYNSKLTKYSLNKFYFLN